MSPSTSFKPQVVMVSKSKPVIDLEKDALKDDDSIDFVYYERKQPPAHCFLEIESFSQLKDSLSKSETDHFQSTEFSAAGHNWILSVYHSGNKKDNGDGHLSLYLKMVDNNLRPGSYINVTLRFAIYDHKRDRYLIAQGETEFHVRGVRKFLPLDSFVDKTNGFLEDDGCVLGVEVLKIDSPTKTCSISSIKKSSLRNYCWPISRFSKLSDRHTSPAFLVEGWSWLKTNYDKILAQGSKLFVEYELCLKNQLKGASHKRIVTYWFTPDVLGYGRADFLPLSDLRDENQGFMINDAIVIEVIFNAMFIMQ